MSESIHAGHRERLRQRFREQGLSGFAEHEVLELLLTYAIARRDVNPLAHELIAQFGSLAAVLEADVSELMRVNGVGESAAMLISLMPELFGRYERSMQGKRPVVSNMEEARAYCRSLFFGAHEEMVYVLCLDKHGRVIHPALLRRGTIDEVAIYPREVVEMVIRYHAHAVLLTHNHPGGDVMPSRADYDVTRRISVALAGIGVPLVDHLILSDEAMFSMKREMGGVQGEPTQYLTGKTMQDSPLQEETVFAPSLHEMLCLRNEEA